MKLSRWHLLAPWHPCTCCRHCPTRAPSSGWWGPMPGPVHWHHTPWPKRGDWVQGSIRADAELWPDWAKRWQVDWLGMSIMSREVWFWLDSFGLAACKSNHRLIDNTANICQISRFLWFTALVYSYGSQQSWGNPHCCWKGPGHPSTNGWWWSITTNGAFSAYTFE